MEYKENDWGDVIILSFDIEEGEFKGFFARNYKEQTGEDKKLERYIPPACSKR